MPKYYFHVRDGRNIPDLTGTELVDMHEVRAAAVTFAGEAIRELGHEFWQSESWQLKVVDDTGRLLLTLDFAGRS